MEAETHAARQGHRLGLTAWTTLAFAALGGGLVIASTQDIGTAIEGTVPV